MTIEEKKHRIGELINELADKNLELRTLQLETLQIENVCTFDYCQEDWNYKNIVQNCPMGCPNPIKCEHHELGRLKKVHLECIKTYQRMLIEKIKHENIAYKISNDMCFINGLPIFIEISFQKTSETALNFSVEIAMNGGIQNPEKKLMVGFFDKELMLKIKKFAFGF